MASSKPAPAQSETPAPQPQPATGFRPIEVPVIDHTEGFTPITVTPVDQAIQAATTQES